MLLEKLQKLKQEIQSLMNDFSIDFVNDYGDANSSSYLSDAEWEFADNNTSCYYCDQEKFYLNNSDYCDDKIKEFYGNDLSGLLKECGSLYYVMCKAGAIGECEMIRDDLYKDENKIVNLIAINYVLANIDEFENLNEDAILEAIEDLDSNIQRMSEIGDSLDALKNEDDE